jgi:hypothetical protein
MLSDKLLQEAQMITKLETLLAWSIKNDLVIHTMLQQDEFSSDVVLAGNNFWLVLDVT